MVFILLHLEICEAMNKIFKLLREKIDSPDFIESLFQLNEERNSEVREALIKNGPLKIVEKGNYIDEIYPKNLVVRRNK